MTTRSELTVVKVGGSLFDAPDLAARLEAWLRRQCFERVLLVPGGGSAANVVRAWDAVQRLGEAPSHWLALRMLYVNAHFLALLLPQATIVSAPSTTLACAILDALAFAQDDEARPDHLPHAWTVTSDAIAARAARVGDAAELILLKSISWDGEDWEAAAHTGVVDSCFPELVRQRPALRVRVVNFRAWLST